MADLAKSLRLCLGICGLVGINIAEIIAAMSAVTPKLKI
jgi:hypothetical protein